MEEIRLLDNIQQIKAISNPIRYRIYHMLISKAMTGSQIARALNIPRQRAHYHLKTLETAGIIKLEEERLKKGMLEKYYRAVAKNLSMSSLFGKEKRKMDSPKNQEIKNKSLLDLNTACLELVREDLNQPDMVTKMANFSLPFYHIVYLTPEQEQEIAKQYYEILYHSINVSNENLEKHNKEELIAVRHTMLITPPYSPEENSEENNSEG